MANKRDLKMCEMVRSRMNYRNVYLKYFFSFKFSFFFIRFVSKSGSIIKVFFYCWVRWDDYLFISYIILLFFTLLFINTYFFVFFLLFFNTRDTFIIIRPLLWRLFQGYGDKRAHANDQIIFVYRSYYIKVLVDCLNYK